MICLTLVFCLSSAIDSGAASVNYLFYRRQYRVTNTHMASLKNMYNWLMLVAQVDKELSSPSPNPSPNSEQVPSPNSFRQGLTLQSPQPLDTKDER